MTYQKLWLKGGLMALLLLIVGLSHAEDGPVEDLDGPELAGKRENASNPLAKVKNTDLRWQYLDLRDGESSVDDYFIDGAFMANPKLKIKYELHYWETDVTGSSESDWESALIKLIYFPKEGIADSGMKYRLAVGADLIYDFDNQDQGIGMGADQFGPFVGVALGLQNGWMVIPLIQHFTEIGGSDLDITAARVIALKGMPARKMWFKADFKFPYDWDAETTPWQGELQLGINVNPSLALYVDALGGITDDRVFDWGAGIGIRFSY